MLECGVQPCPGCREELITVHLDSYQGPHFSMVWFTPNFEQGFPSAQTNRPNKENKPKRSDVKAEC